MTSPDIHLRRPSPPAAPDLMGNLLRSVCRHLTWTISIETGDAHCSRCGVAWTETQPTAEVQQDDNCSTTGCTGDSRYAAPGRGHTQGCRHPFAARPSADTEMRDRVIRDLLESDALTGNSEGAPDLYTVHADDVPHLVDVVLRAALDNDR